ncbi:hypothetical protein ACLOJK_013457 [Asimina triloba]
MEDGSKGRGVGIVGCGVPGHLQLLEDDGSGERGVGVMGRGCTLAWAIAAGRFCQQQRMGLGLLDLGDGFGHCWPSDGEMGSTHLDLLLMDLDGRTAGSCSGHGLTLMVDVTTLA